MGSVFGQVWSGAVGLAALEHLGSRCCPFFSFHSCGCARGVVGWAFAGPLVLWFIYM